ncbi:MAG: superoxide dismutase [Novosphingobium sp.]
MPITLMPLPYEIDALEPHISAATLTLHHGKHHKGYIDKLNEAIADSNYADQSLEDIVVTSHNEGDLDVFNNAAQAWSHGFYWNSLTAKKSDGPSDELQVAIDQNFGSLSLLLETLASLGGEHFGSGWAWLVLDNGELCVITTHDAKTPFVIDNGMIPLLVVDVWEHAYYLDWKNDRPKYLDAVLKNLINWDFASANFAERSVWRYPGMVHYAT